MTPVAPPAPTSESRSLATPILVVVAVIVVSLFVVFLSSSSREASRATSYYDEPRHRALSSPPAPPGVEREALAVRDVGGNDGRAAAQAPPPPPVGQQKVEPVDRKIVYTGQLDLVVKNLDAAEKQADELLSAAGGRLISSESRGDAGSKRTAAFRLEVPVAKFREFVAGLRKLGVPERDKVESSDLTSEYVDIVARVKNMKAEEENLLKLLAERARSVEESLAIRRQIQPLREQIEVAEGRQKFIEGRAALSTVTLNLREEANYVPPTVDPPPAPPTFGDRVSKTFSASWGMLVTFGEGLALFGVALGPWLAVLLPVGFLGWLTARRFRRSTPAAADVGPVSNRPG